MPLPPLTPTIVDNFTGSNGSINGRTASGGATWSAPLFSVHSAAIITSNQLGGSASDVSAALSSVDFGPNCYVGFTWGSAWSAGVYLYARIQQDSFPITYPGSYDLYYCYSAVDNISVTRVIAGTGVYIGSLGDTTHSWASGDKVAITFTEVPGGTEIIGYFDSGSGWTRMAYPILDANPGRPSNAGHIGVEIDSNATPRIDDLVAGQLVLPSSSDSYSTVILGDTPLAYYVMNEDVNAFETQPLDTFDRANGGLGTNWSNDPFGWGANTLTINTNQVGASVAQASQYWNVSDYGPDCEVAIDVPVVPSAGKRMSIYARADTTGHNGYELLYYDGIGFRLFSVTAGIETQLGGDIAWTLNNTDKFGLRCIGSSIEAWVYTASLSDWTRLAVRTDTTYNSAGKFAVYIEDTTTRIDNFRGGSISSVWQLPLDYSGNGYHMDTRHGIQTHGVVGPISVNPGDVAIFNDDTVESRYRYRNGLSTQLTSGDVFSLECWAKPKDTTFGAEEGLVNLCLSGGGAIYIVDGNLDGIAQVQLAKSEVAVIALSTNNIADALWHHIVATKNGTTSKIYLDGIECTGTVTNATCVANGNASNFFTEGPGYVSFDGSLTRIAIYNYALSATQVLNHYNAATQAPFSAKVPIFQALSSVRSAW